MTEASRIYGKRADLTLCTGAPEALQGADALAICTEWQEFRSPDFARIKSSLKQPVIFDGRNLYDPAFVAGQGIHYFGIGRGDKLPG
jgi:UDPglucose 6-dehydrogenase